MPEDVLDVSIEVHEPGDVPIAVIPRGYVLFCGTVNRPEAFIQRTMQVCVE
jgi:hypothetical protein